MLYPITLLQKDIAQLICTTRQTIITLFKELENEGMLQYSQKKYLYLMYKNQESCRKCKVVYIRHKGALPLWHAKKINMRNWLMIITMMVALQLKGQVSRHFNAANGLALDGYDVVAYFTDRKAKKGVKSNCSQYEGLKWCFANDQNREIFTDPNNIYLCMEVGVPMPWATAAKKWELILALSKS